MTSGRPLRVAYVTASLDLGGSERQMVALAQYLPKSRFEVDFVLLTEGGPLAPVAEAAGARVRNLDWPRGGGLANSVRRGAGLLKFSSTLRAGRYDIVDAWLFHAHVITALTRPATRVPVLIAGRRSLGDYKKGFGPALRLLDGLSRSCADLIVANSIAVRDAVVADEHVDPTRIRVIRNGVHASPPMSPVERAARRAAWGYGPSEIVVGCVANYKPLKGLESVLRVASELKDSTPELRFVLVGDGPSRHLLERMVNELDLADAVRLHGREADARDLYGAFDIVVLASESEGLPNALLEGAAAGRAIVATAAGGAVDVVIDGKTGLLVPVHDDGALARAIHQLAGDGLLRERLGLAARRRAEAVFGMERFVAETAALYEELAERRRLTTR